MREILFKAKRITTGEWVEGWIVQNRQDTYQNGFRIIETYGINYDELDDFEPSFISWKVEESTICQYTGLTDKNGNKIWENDIIYNPAEERYFKVCWKKNGGIWVMHSIDDVNYIVDFEWHYWSHDVEVVGNIFDNKELIGE